MTAKQITLTGLLKDGLFIDGDWVETKDQDPAGDVRLIQLADIGDGVFRNKSAKFLTTAKAHELGCTFLEPGDVLVARMPEPLGRACIFPGIGQSAVTAVDVCILRPNPSTASADWLVKAINSPDFRSSMQQFIRGTTRQRISRKNLGALTLSAPALPEQIRVSRVLDAAIAKRSSAASHVGTGSRAIQALRRSILAAACSGRLTADWRDEHPGSAAEISLADISAKRDLLLDRRKKQPLVPPAEGRFRLPEQWVTSSLDAVCTRITSGSRDWSRFYGSGNGTFVMAQNVRSGYLDWSFRQAVDPPPGDRSRERSQIALGDLLVTIVGANTGDVGPVNESRPEHYVCQSVALVRPADTRLTDFLNLWFNSPQHGRRYLDECIYGAGRPHLSFDQLKSAPIAIPSFAEQTEIVRRVSELFSTTEELLTRIGAASTAVEQSSRAILAKAFRGELLPTAEVESAV